MGTTYDPKASILGMEARRFRQLLGSWYKHRDPRVVARVASLGTHAHEVAAVVDEAEARGFLDYDADRFMDHEFGYTETGKALMSATNRKRIKAADAWDILMPLLENAADANRQSKLPFSVKRIWLYGSLAKGSETVDDIDIVLETGTPDHMTMDQADKLAWNLCHRMGGESAITFGTSLAYDQANRWVQDRLLYGPRRHQRLSVKNEPRELIGMGAPCKLIFDERYGPRPDAPLLPRHPHSGGRDPRFPPPRISPDLGAAPALAPAHCSAVRNLALANAGNRAGEIIAVYSPDRHDSDDLDTLITGCGPLDGRGRTLLRSWDRGGQVLLVEAQLEERTLYVETSEVRAGVALDSVAVEAYLQAIFQATLHRAAILGETIESGFLNGEEVDVGNDEAPGPRP